MGFLRQEYWSGLPFPSPGALPHPGAKPASPALAGVCETDSGWEPAVTQGPSSGLGDDRAAGGNLLLHRGPAQGSVVTEGAGWG